MVLEGNRGEERGEKGEGRRERGRCEWSRVERGN